MTDIEKKTYKVTLIRAVTIGISLIVCTWKISSVVNSYSEKVDRLDAFVKSHTVKDSVRDERVAKLEQYRNSDRHDIDSMSLILKAVTLRVHPVMEYYTQKRVNGRLYKIPVTQ